MTCPNCAYNDADEAFAGGCPVCRRMPAVPEAPAVKNAKSPTARKADGATEAEAATSLYPSDL